MSKIWFVTGSSRGFGRRFVEAALTRGDKVVATARHAESLAGLAAVHGERVLPLSLTDRAAVFAAVQRAHEHFGRIDVVVNNAGYGLYGMVEEIKEQEIRAQFETNVFGAPWVTQAARDLLGAGFDVIRLHSTLEEALAFGARSRAMLERGETPPNRATVLMDREIATQATANSSRGFSEARIIPIEVLARKPSRVSLGAERDPACQPHRADRRRASSPQSRSILSWATLSPMPKPCSLPVSSAYRWTILRRPATQGKFHATTSPADAGRAFHHRPRPRTGHRQAQLTLPHPQHGAHHHE